MSGEHTFGASDDIVRRIRENLPHIEWEQPLSAERERLAADAIEELRVERDASRLIISDLTAEVERLRDEMSTMHRTVVHDCCVQVQSERALADQLASHLEWALRCVGSLPTEMRMTFDNRMAEVFAAHREARRG